jgi:hypothetical protein
MSKSPATLLITVQARSEKHLLLQDFSVILG